MDKNTKEINIGNVGKIILTKNIQAFINKLHSSIGATEWSGVLFYKITNGNIKDLKNLEITTDFLYPMNIGDSSYTEFDYSGELMNAYDINEQAMEMSYGMVHSHHSMGAFFSPTDIDELKSNCQHYNFYISLIVNFNGNYCAKIAIPSKAKSQMKLSYTDEIGNNVFKKRDTVEDVIMIGDLSVEFEGVECPVWLTARIEELKNKKKLEDAQKSNLSRSLKYNNLNYGNNAIFSTFNGRDPDDLLGNNGSFDTHVVKMDGRNYLSALISLDTEKINEPIYETINRLKDIDECDLELLSEAIDNNSDIIYEELFPEDTTYDNIVPITIDALEILLSLESKLSGNPVYEMLIQSLKEYARHYKQ